jgi:hypothetical protein
LRTDKAVTATKKLQIGGGRKDADGTLFRPYKLLRRRGATASRPTAETRLSEMPKTILWRESSVFYSQEKDIRLANFVLTIGKIPYIIVVH